MKKYISLIRDFLTKNTSSKQTVIKNTFWLLLAEGISKGSLAILIIMIGRIFGKEVFGQYSYLSVILTFLVVFADMGLTQLAVRDYQHVDTAHRRQYLVTGLWTKLWLSLAVCAVYMGILRYTADTSFLWIIGLILLTNNLTNSFLEYIRSTFRSLQKGETELRIKLIQGIGNLLLIPLLYVFKSLPLNLLGQSIVTVITIGYAWWLVHKRQLAEHMPEVMVTKGELVRNGWMFAMNSLFVGLYYYIDTIIIKAYRGYSEMATYNAAYRIIVLLTLPLAMLGGAIMPTFSNMIKNNISEFNLNVKRYSKIIFIGYACFIALVYLFTDILVLTLFGYDFIESINTLKILLISLIVMGLHSVYSPALYCLGRQKEHFIATAVGVIFNLVCNLFIIPLYGSIGAAFVTIATEIVIASAMIYFYNKYKDRTL